MIEHVQARTFHSRRGKKANSFSYGVDYLLQKEKAGHLPAILSKNSFNLWSVHDLDHGGEREQGSGFLWFRRVLKESGCDAQDLSLSLLAQPRFLWFRFSPVSFWIAEKHGELVAFIAEVNNTFGDRHCYLCAHPGFQPIQPNDILTAIKLMHVSPFQEVEGAYHFQFELNPENISIRISYENGNEGVLATLTGKRHPASNASLLYAAFRRPLGAFRVLALIHWQAVRLALKRATYLRKPPAPSELLSESTEFRKDIS